MRRLFGAVAATLACCGPSAAAETPKPAASPAETLLQKLGSPRFQDREIAGRDLVKLGAAALPAVRATLATTTDPEIRERATAVLDQLTKAADSAQLLAAKPVKLDYKAMPLASAVMDFRQKTGIPLVLVPGRVANSTKPITLTTAEVSAWEALDALCNAAGLREDHRLELPAPTVRQQVYSPYNSRVYYDNDESNRANYTPSNAPIFLIDGPDDHLPAVRTGGVRVLAMPRGFVANRLIRGSGRIVINLDVAPLPALNWQGANSVRIATAEDEDGRPIFADLKSVADIGSGNSWDNGWAWRGGGRRVFWGGGGMMIEDSGGQARGPNDNPRLLAVALRTDDRAIRRLKVLAGTVVGDIHTLNVPVITVENLSGTAVAGKVFEGPGQTKLTILEYKKRDDGSIALKIKYETLTQWAMQQMGLNARGLFVNDNVGEVVQKLSYYNAAGKLIAAKPTQENSNYTGDGIRQGIEMTLRFPKSDNPPARLVLTGTKVSAVEVPFHLVDVKLP